MEWFLKPASDWKIDDFDHVVEQEVPEGPRFELKQSLPLNDGSRGWNEKRQIHPSERDGLAKEIVALANMYGGNILVGIKETTDSPKRAESLAEPLPSAADLAERLRASMVSIIQPPIAGLSICHVAHSTEPEAGYIVITVPQSVAAPHGFGQPAQAYIRRDESASPMSMHDLQNTFWEARTKRERIDQIASFNMAQLRQMQIIDPVVAYTFFAISENVLSLSNFTNDFLNGKVLNSATSVASYATASAAPLPAGAVQWQPNSIGLELRPELYDFGQGIWTADESGVVSVTGSVAVKNSRDSEPTVAVEWFLKTLGHLTGLAQVIGEYSNDSPSWIVGGAIRSDRPVAAFREGFNFRSPPKFQGFAPIRTKRFDPTFSQPSVVPICSAVWGAFHQLDSSAAAYNEGYQELMQFSYRA